MKYFYFLIVCTLIFNVQQAIGQVPAASSSTGSANSDMNWILSKSFDQGGSVIGEQKKFFDNTGRLIQMQNKVKYRKNSTTVYNHVFASQPIRDAYQRDALTTLAAPIDNSEFIYKGNFVRQGSGATVYDYRHFDRFKPLAVETDKTEAPDAVGNAAPGTLGWYYSANNTWEPYTPTTSYPYLRQSFYRDGTGNIKKNAGPTEEFRMGSGHETRSFTTSVTNELDHYLTVRNKYFTSAGALPTTLKTRAVQTISRDANGKEVVVIQDQDGRSLFVGRPGNELAVSNTVRVEPKYVFYINGGANNSVVKNLKITCSGVITIRQSTDGGLNYYWMYTGLASSYVSPATLPNRYKIETDLNFSVSYDATLSVAPNTTYTACNNCPAEVNGQSQHYFKLFAPSTVSMTTPQYWQLINMDTEQPISFTSGNSLAAGYYKLISNRVDFFNLTYGNSYADVSYSFYNQLGQLIATIAPEGVKKLYGTGINNYATKDDIPYVTLYEYDVQGRLVSTESSDVGKGEIIYRKDGKVRFSQNAEQQATGRFSYTNYDALGRPIQSGELLPDAGLAFNSDLTATTNPMRDILESTATSGGLPSAGTKRDVVTTIYDVPDNAHGLTAYVQDPYTLRGAVSKTIKCVEQVYGVNPWVNIMGITWYNYDEEGKVLWTIDYVRGINYKTTDYTYNALGQVVKKVYQKDVPSETFVHYYEYDPANSQLWKVYTNTVDNPTTKTLQATYIYYLHGPLKRVELATDLQGIDYTYTLQGALKAINNNDKTKDPGGDGTTFKTDAFGMVLDYYPGDYTNSRVSGIQPIKGVNTSSIVPVESYAGNIKAMSWFSKKPAAVLAGNPNAENPNAYVFNYDDKYQFTESTWGTTLNFGNTPVSFTSTAFNKEKVRHPTSGVPGYDANGNITYLQRYNTTGAVTDKFTYNYQTNTNKLTSVVHDNSGTPQTYASYTYDALGQLTYENTLVPANKKYIKYDVTGKVLIVARDAAFTQKVAEYVYNERGERIIKRSYNSSYQHIQNTYYVAGVVYTQPVTGGNPGSVSVQEYEIDGGISRIGTFYRPASVYAYEMTDHLGNVRAVVAKNAGNLEIRMYTDYYPYGMVIQSGGTSYRYQYQGQYAEKDAETDWNAFELRMYDGRIARWLTTDPAGQFHSPYLSMGNNPVSMVDPDGGYSRFGAWWRNIVDGGGGIYKSGKEWGYNTSIENGITGHFGNEGRKWYHTFRNDGFIGGIAGQLNKFNPLANFVNGISGLTTGQEWETGQQVNSAEASLTLMSTLPIGRGGSVVGKPILNAVNTGERIGSAAYKSLNAGDAQHFFSEYSG